MSTPRELLQKTLTQIAYHEGQLQRLREERDRLADRIGLIHQAAILTDQPYALESTHALITANTHPALPPDVPALRLFEEEDPERWDFMS